MHLHLLGRSSFQPSSAVNKLRQVARMKPVKELGRLNAQDSKLKNDSECSIYLVNCKSMLSIIRISCVFTATYMSVIYSAPSGSSLGGLHHYSARMQTSTVDMSVSPYRDLLLMVFQMYDKSGTVQTTRISIYMYCKQSNQKCRHVEKHD